MLTTILKADIRIVRTGIAMVPRQTRAAKAVKEAAGEPESPDVIEAEYSDGGAVLDEQVSVAETSPEEEEIPV